MNTRKALMLAAGLAAILSALPAAADDGPRSRSGVSFGPRGEYYKPKGAPGSWSGGAQLRFHLGPVVAIEGSADYRQTRVNDDVIDVFPVQGSLLLYLIPNSPVTPYLLGGGGWYYTHSRQTDVTDNRFAPHAGAGVEVFLDRHWSLDGSYRYIWASDVTTGNGNTTATFRDRGYMVTAALNYRF